MERELNKRAKKNIAFRIVLNDNSSTGYVAVLKNNKVVMMSSFEPEDNIDRLKEIVQDYISE